MLEQTDILSIGAIAAAIGSLVTIILNIVFRVLFTNYVQIKSLVKNQKMEILRDLMATRFNSPLDQNAAESINFIPVLFAESEQVLKAYEDFYDARGLPSCGHKFNALVAEIAKDVGITFKPLDLLRMPIFTKKQELEMAACNEEYNALIAGMTQPQPSTSPASASPNP